MKCICDMCDGTGYVKEASTCMDYPYVKECPKCKGNGYKVEQEQTNDEWRRTCSTEEFAKWIYDIRFDFQIPWKNKEIVQWLKEIHNE